MKNLVTLVYLICSLTLVAEEHLAVAEKDNKMGFIDQKCKWVIPPSYDKAYSFEDGAAIVEVKKKLGLINTQGKYILDPNFNYIKIEEGIAVVELKGKWGYYTTAGEELVQPKYKKAKAFKNGHAMAMKDTDHWVYINNEGTEHDLGPNMKLHDYSEGRGLIYDIAGGQHGYTDEEGEWFIKPQFEKAKSFSEGLARVRRSDLWGFIDRNGEWVVKPIYGNARDFSNGFARVMNTDGVWNYMNKEGKEIERDYKIELLFDFSEGLARVESRDKMGIIDQTGAWVVEAQYAAIKPIYGQYIYAKQSGKWGIMDRTGKWLVTPRYDDIGYYSNGRIPVRIGKKWGFLNDEFYLSIKADYDEVYFAPQAGYSRYKLRKIPLFVGGLTCVKEGKQYVMINRQGEQVCGVKFDYLRPFVVVE